jgi:signal transduction histidine kinase
VRPLVPILVVALLVVGVVAFLAERQAESQRSSGLREQALTLAEAVKGAALEAQQALEAAEGHLAARLASAARRAETLLQQAQAPTQDLLDRVAREERVGRVALLAPDGSLVALARHPARLPADGGEAAQLRAKADAVEQEELEAAARELAPAPGATVPEGLALQRLAGRERFGLAYGRPAGGTLLLRAEADEVVSLRRRFGLAPVLERIGAQPGVSHAAVIGPTGDTLLSAPAAPAIAARVYRPWPDDVATLEADAVMHARVLLSSLPGTTLWVEVGVRTDRADAARGAARRVVLLGAGLAALGLLGAALLLGAHERQRRRAERAATLAREEEARLAQMGALAALVTHEVSNPLNAVRLGLSVLETAPESERGAVLDSLKSEAARMGRTLESFLGLARGTSGARGRVEPALLARVAERVGAQAAAADVRVEVEVEPGAPAAQGDPIVLEQALANLARNALGAAPRGSRVRLAWQRDPEGRVRVRVDDSGPGFPAQGREALLRVGAPGRADGHGLGLPLAERFVRQQGGRMLLLDRPEGGARVEVLLAAEGSTSPAPGGTLA